MLRFRLLGLYVIFLVVMLGVAIGAVAGLRTPPGAATSVNHENPVHQ